MPNNKSLVDLFEGSLSPTTSHDDDRCSSATLWLWDGSDVQENELSSFAMRLSASEKRRFANFTRPIRRRQFVLGRMLLRLAVARLTGLRCEQVSVLEEAGKAPLLLWRNGDVPPKFSLSHSGDWLGCAVSDRVTLGLDVEVNKPNRAFDGISAMAFCSEEQIWLKSQPHDERIAAFYSLWCAREAGYKLYCNLGHECAASLSPGYQEDGVFQSTNRYLYHLPVADLGLTAVLSSDQPLSAIRQRRLNRFNDAGWPAVTDAAVIPEQILEREKRNCITHDPCPVS